MERIVEPELMEDAAQARAYAAADFERAHSMIMRCFARWLPEVGGAFDAVDLGCGDADVAVRLAKMHRCARIVAVDGSREMLRHARKRLARERLAGRVRLVEAVLPHVPLPEAGHDVIVSNSLLHHLHDPRVLWSTVRRLGKPSASVFIADLARPASRACAATLVERHAAREAPVLKRDFYNSLLAAFTPREIEDQLERAGLARLSVRRIDDYHVAVCGGMDAQ